MNYCSFNNCLNYDLDSDITGSPLNYSFGKDSFNESVISSKRYWLKEEEYHLPINIEDAR